MLCKHRISCLIRINYFQFNSIKKQKITNEITFFVIILELKLNVILLETIRVICVISEDFIRSLVRIKFYVFSFQILLWILLPQSNYKTVL